MKRGAALALVLMLAACSGTSASGSSSTTLTVFAAASLQDAFEAIASAYEQETGVELALSFDASSALRMQISEGADVDLFASADRSKPQQLSEDGETEGDPVPFAGNGLAIVAPADGSGIQSWQALGEPGTQVVAAGDWAGLVGPAAPITVSSPDPVAGPNGTVMFPKGTIELQADQVWPYISGRGANGRKNVSPSIAASKCPFRSTRR